MAIAYILLFLGALVFGAWMIGLGVLLGLDPTAVYLVSTAGSLAAAAAVLFAGGPWRDRLVERFLPDAERRVREGRASQILDRWGIPGLAFGSILIGVLLTLVAVLVLGLDRIRFMAWFAAVTCIGYVGITLFWIGLRSLLDGSLRVPWMP